MKKIYLFLFVSLLLCPSLCFSIEKDATFHACIDYVSNGENASEFHNGYLMGIAFGIMAGTQLTYEKHEITDTLPEHINWPQKIDEACRLTIVEKSNKRALYVFQEKYYEIYTTN